MPTTTRTPAPTGVMNKFRVLTEGFLMQVAQEAMLEEYPGLGVKPVPKEGWIYPWLRFLFLPGFKLTPWPLRSRLMSLFFVHSQQRWSPQRGPAEE